MRQEEDNELFSFHLWVYVNDGYKNRRISVKKGMAGALMMLRFGEMDSLMSLPMLWNPRNFFPVSGNKLLSYSK